MEYKINDLLILLKNASENPELLKGQELSEAVCYYSKEEKKFFQNFQNFENTKSRLEVYSSLLIFLPITQNIIKIINEKKFFKSDDLQNEFIEREEGYVSNYFSQSKKFYKGLKNINLDSNDLKNRISDMRAELDKLEKENKNLQNKSSRINELKKGNIQLRKKIVDNKISSEENFKLDKLYEKVERFNKKLQLLKESYE